MFLFIVTYEYNLPMILQAWCLVALNRLTQVKHRLSYLGELCCSLSTRESFSWCLSVPMTPTIPRFSLVLAPDRPSFPA